MSGGINLKQFSNDYKMKTSLLQTLTENKDKYIKEDIKWAEKVTELQ